MTSTNLQKANYAFKRRQYAQAMELYKRAKIENPAIAELADQNIGITLQRVQGYNVIDKAGAIQDNFEPNLSEVNTGQLHPLKGSDVAAVEEVDVMVSCWLGSLEALHEGLKSLVIDLRGRGLRSKLMCRSGQVADFFQNDLDDDLIQGSFSVLGAWSLLSIADMSPLDLPLDFIDQIILEDRGFRRRDQKSPITLYERNRVRFFYSYWHWYLRVHQVKIFLIWGDTAPASKLFIRLCTELGIEYYIMERGHFAGTLYFDPMGQYGSGLRQRGLRNLGVVSGMSAIPIEQRFEEISAWYWKSVYSIAGSQEAQKEAETLRKRKETGQQIVTVIGANDYGAGLRANKKTRLSWVQSSRDVFDYVMGIVEKKFSNAYVVYRPHPSDRNHPEPTERSCVATEVNIDELIKLSDVCINIGSTTYAACLIQQKLTLVLGATDSLSSGPEYTVIDKTMLLPMLRQYLWGENADTSQHRLLSVDLFDNWLVGCNDNIPTRLVIHDIAQHLFDRTTLLKSKYALAMIGEEDRISEVMCNEVTSRKRMIFENRDAPDTKYNSLSVIIPVYGDYEGTRRCIECTLENQPANNYRVFLVWDRGPDLRLRALCREYKNHPHVTVVENKENVGFSGAVNSAILKSAPDDVILLNSDTVVCTNWARRMQQSAYAHPKLGTVVPFSNNATAWNVPFPNGQRLPKEDTINWVKAFDERAKSIGPKAFEMPTGHGFCIFIKRTMISRIGLFDEMKFGVGQSEDNEFAMRMRASGYCTALAMNVFVGHDGSTSFADTADAWRAHGRQVLTQEFSHYIKEVRHFYADDPLADYRRIVLGEDASKSEII